MAWYGEGEYQIACRPDESAEDWQSELTERLEIIYDEVESKREQREREVRDEEDEIELIEYNGEKYVSAFVGDNSDVQGQAGFYLSILDEEEDHTGIVLRSYPRWVVEVEELAEQICDDDVMSETVCPYRFEQVKSELPTVDGNKEFRVFLRETRFLP